MLIIWHAELHLEHRGFLVSIDAHAHFWPRTKNKVLQHQFNLPNDWWISFSHPKFGMVWLLKYPDYSQIIFKE